MPRLRRARLDMPVARAAERSSYRVSALHVNHGLRGEESDVDARFCRDVLGAEVVDAPAAQTEAELRDIRYSYATDRLRATGHTASDNVETVLYRLVSSGRPGGIKPKREDGIVRPLLSVWREETEAYCDGGRAAVPHGLHERRHEARTHSHGAPARSSSGSTRARERISSRWRSSRPSAVFHARSSGRCSSSSRPPTGRKKPTSATESTPYASTTA